jgi:hypothetical protein
MTSLIDQVLIPRFSLPRWLRPARVRLVSLGPSPRLTEPRAVTGLGAGALRDVRTGRPCLASEVRCASLASRAMCHR